MKTFNKTNTAQNSDNAKMKIRATIRRYIFFFVILFIPLAQFCIFYVGTNINTIVMSFQKYDNGVFIGNGWKNYEEFFSMFSTDIRLVTQIEILLCLFDCKCHTISEIRNKTGYGESTIRRHLQELSIYLPIEIYKGSNGRKRRLGRRKN